LLADKEILYEIQEHDVKPDSIDEYETIVNDFMPKLKAKYADTLSLTGSWKTEIGHLDKYVHLWRFNSYAHMSEVNSTLRKDSEYQTFNRQLCKTLRKRENQVCFAFTYWDTDQVKERETFHIYELRSYSLKPGTLYEWKENW
jgi:hypothetical protein